MPSLNSSNLASYDYDEETRALRLTFRSGSTYSYANVPPEVVEGLVTSPSPGGYHHRNIKDRYSYVREA